MNCIIKKAQSKNYSFQRHAKKDTLTLYKNHDILEKHLQAFIKAYNYTKPLKTLKGLWPHEKICLYVQNEEAKSYFNSNHEFKKGDTSS